MAPNGPPAGCDLSTNRDAAFRERLKALHEVTLDLSSAPEPDDLCCLAVQLGCKRLGFSRLGLWFPVPGASLVRGTFGVDEAGRIRDERSQRLEVRPESPMGRVLSSQLRVAVLTDAELPDDRRRVVGRGTHAHAALWDGNQVIGCLCADDLLAAGTWHESDTELLALYASAIGRIWARLEDQLALRAARDEWARTFDAVPDLIAVVDENYRIVKANQAVADRLGLSPPECAGLICHEALHGLPVPKEGCPQEHCLRTGEPVHFEWHEPRLGAYFQMSVTPLIDAQGRRSATVHVAHDITAVRAAERDARAEKAFADTLLDAQEDVVTAFDTQTGRLVRWNEAFMRVTQFAPDELTATDALRDFVPPYAQQAAREALAELLELGRGTIELPLLRRDGHTVPYEFSATLIDGGNGRPLALVVGRDLTARKQAEEARLRFESELQHLQKLESLSVLAGGVAHDFSNILAAALGSAELAAEDLPRGSTTRALVETIIEQCMRATALARQMLAYSGRGRFVVKSHDVSRLVEEAGPLLESSLGDDVRLQCRLATDLPEVEADAVELNQVLVNLALNAAEALPDSRGGVTITTGVFYADRDYLSAAYRMGYELRSGRYVFIEVEDAGCGMTEEVRERMFEPFFSTKFVGRGLGLAAVLGIVRGHHGAIIVDTEPGRGTRIRVLLPPVGAS